MQSKEKRAGRPGTLGRFIAALALGAAAVALAVLGGANAEFLKNVYRPFSRAAEHVLSKITSVVPFSIYEFLIYLAVLGGLTAIVLIIIRLIRKPHRLRFLANVFSVIALVASAGVFLFYALWGLNYKAEPLADTLGLETRARDSSALVELNEYLIENANRLSKLVERNDEGLVADFDFVEVGKRVAAEVSKLTGKNEAPPKYVLASVPMSYTQISGVFMFLTGESNVNTNSTNDSLPYVMAHELSHRWGIAREDEANFFAFLALFESEDPLLAYSAYRNALAYCQNKLASADRDEWVRLYFTYSEELTRDGLAYNEHWKQYEGKVAEVSDTVNDTYLQVQGQTDGVKSYGRMVDLMLAWFEAERSA